MEGEWEVCLLERRPDLVEDGRVQGFASMRVGTAEAGDEAEVLDPRDLLHRRHRVLERQRAHAGEARRSGVGVVGDPIVVDLAGFDCECRVPDSTELQTESRVQDRDMDAFSVEHLDPFRRVEPRWIEVLVVHALPEVLEGQPGVAETR